MPEVFNSTYDIRKLLAARKPLRDSKEFDITGSAFLRNLLLDKIEATEVGEMLKQFHLVGD